MQWSHLQIIKFYQFSPSSNHHNLQITAISNPHNHQIITILTNLYLETSYFNREGQGHNLSHQVHFYQQVSILYSILPITYKSRLTREISFEQYSMFRLVKKYPHLIVVTRLSCFNFKTNYFIND